MATIVFYAYSLAVAAFDKRQRSAFNLFRGRTHVVVLLLPRTILKFKQLYCISIFHHNPVITWRKKHRW